MCVDDVRGAVYGPISTRYGAMLCRVMTWPAHHFSERWPARLHTWWSEAPTGREALAEYIAANRRVSTLGDGTPCIEELEEAQP